MSEIPKGRKAARPPTASVVRLLREVSRLNKAVEENEARLSSYEKRLRAQEEVIESFSEVPPVFEKGDYELFMESAAVAEFAGEYVAFCPGKGLIAHGVDDAEVAGAVARHPEGKTAIIGFVPHA